MMPALPFPALPRTAEVRRRGRPSERAAADLDTLLAILPEGAPDARFAALPHADRWRSLRAEARKAVRAVASTPLPNARHTQAVLGLLPERAGAFERLSLAGRMLKEARARERGRIGLLAPAQGDALAALLSAALTRAFELPAFRSASASRQALPQRALRHIEVFGTEALDLPFIEAAASGNNLARHLTALPPNVLDASAYRRLIAALARKHGLTLRWLGERALERLGAGAFLAVARGNPERTAGIAHLSYRPGRRRTARPDVALIGKGILFDTGGTNLKPHRAMLDMHTDMAGSAVALATLVGLSRLRAPLAADAWLAITENAIGPRAYRPQDVVRAANGTTIQVVHTDAEGRMVLADALALAGRSAPRLMIDFGTLTGTCVQALTERMSGLTTNEPRLMPRLLDAGRTSGERVWGFPYEADYDTDLESKAADVLQCSVDSKGDHLLAARFLGRFVPAGAAWVHLDLSSAVRSGGLADIDTDVTGFGVRYALELILKARVLDEIATP